MPKCETQCTMSIDRLHELRISNQSTDLDLESATHSTTSLTTTSTSTTTSLLNQLLSQISQLKLETDKLHYSIHLLEQSFRLPELYADTSTAETSALRKSVLQASTDIQHTFSLLRARYDQINGQLSQASSLNTSERRLLLHKLMNAGNRLEAATVTFRDAQTAYNRQQQSLFTTRIRTALGPASVTEQQLNEYLSNPSTSLAQATRSIFNTTALGQHANEQQFLDDMLARHADIVKIEEGVGELQEMFVHLNTLVVQQGLQIDEIERTVDNADVFVQKGTVMLRKATKKAKFKRIVILILICIVVLVALGLVLKFLDTFSCCCPRR